MGESLLINGVHLVLTIAGFFIVSRIAEDERRAKLIWPVTLVASAIVAGFLFIVSDPGVPFEDFRKAYYQGGAALLAGHDAMAAMYASDVQGFVNPPIVAVFFAPFALLPEKIGATLFAALAGATMLYALDRIARIARIAKFEQGERALFLFAAAAFGPLIHSLRQANTTHLLLALLVAGFLAVRGNKQWLAGLAYGVAALIKPPLAIFGIYYFLRGKWKVWAAGAATLVAAAVLSILLFGWEMNVAWYEACIAPFAGGVVAGFNAQSIAAGLIRFELGPEVLWNWDPFRPSPLMRAAILAANAAIVLAALWLGWRARKAGRVDDFWEFSLVLTVACLVSTLSWSHYFLWLLPAFALLYALSRRGAPDADLRPWLVAAYALAAPAEFLSEPMRNGEIPLAMVWVSHLLIAGIITYALLWVTERRAQRRQVT